MRTLWFGFFLLVVAVGGGFVLLGPDRMYHLFLDTGRKVAPQIFVEDTSPKPEQTLVAPFAEPDTGAAAAAGDKKPAFLPFNAVPLDQPHRTADEIANWLVTAVSNALSFSPQNFAEVQNTVSNSFTPEGLAAYRSFLATSGFQSRVAQNNEVLRNYIQELPFLLNKGEVGGVYHWLFEVPVMVSFMPVAHKDPKDFDGVTEEIMVNVDVLRVAGEVGESVRIHSWTVKLKSDP